MGRKQDRNGLSEDQRRQALCAASVGLWNWYVPTDELIVDQYTSDREISNPEQIRSQASTMKDFIHPDDFDGVINAIQMHTQQNTHFEAEHRIRMGINDWKWVSTRGQVVERDEHGGPLRVAAEYRDSAKHDLMGLPEQMYRTILSNISDTVVITDNKGSFKFICPNIQVIFGYSEEEIRSRGNIVNLLGRDLLAQYPMHENEEITNIELQVWDKNDSLHTLLVNIKAVPIFDGTILFTCRDITERKQTEKALHDSEEQSQQLSEAAFEGLAIHYEGTILEANQSFCEMYGYKRSEIVGMSVLDVTAPESRHLGQRRIADGKTHVYEAVAMRKDGSKFQVELAGRPINYHGRAARIVAVHDISERKKAEEALRQSEAKYRLIVNSAHEGIWQIDNDSRTTYANPHMAEMLGLSQDEMLGKTFYEFIDTSLQKQVRKLSRRRQQEGSIQTEIRYKRKDGSRIWGLVASSNLYDDKGQQIGAIALITDITERKNAEEALQQQFAENIRAKKALDENEAALATLINSVDDTIFSIDKDIHLISFNTAFVRRSKSRYGITLQKGMAIADHFPETLRNIYAPLFERVLCGESFLAPRHVYMPELGIDLYNEVSCNPIYSVSGEVVGAGIYVRDITESKKAEMALRASEERFRRVVENVPLAFHIYDFEQRKFLYTNPLFNRTVQYLTGQSAADPLLSLENVHPEDRSLLLDGLNNREVVDELEYRVIYPSGDLHYVRQISFPIAENDAQVLQVATFSEDITERKRIETALQESERLLTSVINHSLNSIAAFTAIRDSKGKIIDFEYRLVNPNVTQLLSRSTVDVIGKHLSEEVPATIKEGLLDQFVRVVETGEILDIEYANKDLLLTYFHLTGVKLNDGLVVTASNITEQKKNQNALVESRALLETILANLPTGVAVTSLDGRFLSVNARYAALINYTAEELLEHNIAEVLSRDQVDLWSQDNAAVLKTGKYVQTEVTEIIDGVSHTVLVGGFPLHDTQGNIFAIGRVVVDITDQKQIQDQLRDLSRQIVEVQEKERRHIARELHDEVGQSLTGVLLLLNKLERTSSDVNAGVVNQIQTVVRQLMAQIRELSLNLHPPILDNHGLLGALRWYCTHYSTQTQIPVSFKYTGLQRRLLPEIELTCYRIIQEALTNVARYAQAKEASVKVSVNRKRIKLFIEDSGIGFDVEQVRAKNTTFGLAGMSERVTLLKGKIGIRSSLGHGTSISVEIPLVDNGSAGLA